MGNRKHPCKVWRFDATKKEAIIMLSGQMCTLKTTDIQSSDPAGEGAMHTYLGQATVTSPMYAKVRLGEWVPSTYSFSGSDFYMP